MGAGWARPPDQCITIVARRPRPFFFLGSGGVGVTVGNPVFIGTDNRCCFCLTLRTGSVIVGVVNALVSTLLFSW